MKNENNHTNDYQNNPLLDVTTNITRLDERVNNIRDDVNALKKDVEENSDKLSEVEEMSKDNKQYIERVRSSIKNGLINFLLPVAIAVISWILQKF